MKQTLQFRTSQHLALTPQLQQAIRLLQLSTFELHQEIEKILLNNPLLERLNDPFDQAIRVSQDGTINLEKLISLPSLSSESQTQIQKENIDTAETEHALDESNEKFDPDTPTNANSCDAPEWSANSEDVMRFPKASEDSNHAQPQIEAHHLTLREHLMEQVRLNLRQPRDQALVELIIEAVDENGYLEESLEDIHARLPPELDIDIEELSTALTLLQSFDPAGVGGRNASECLSIQIKRLPKIPLVTRRMALLIVEHHFVWFAQREFNKLKKVLNCDDEDLREVQAVIKQCQPHPGAIFVHEISNYVVPDVVVTHINNTWQVMLNHDVIPLLRINRMYAQLLKQNKNGAALVSQLQEAKSLIKNMRRRFDTILLVARAIVERQKNFFTHGAIAMRPLVLREIAGTLGLHESTISRITTEKYMLTPHGIFELKYFFGSRLATDAGGESSSTAIQALIKQLIGAENQKNPLSDSKIADFLKEQGMIIARRTVAKYREALKIPPVNLRKLL